MNSSIIKPGMLKRLTVALIGLGIILGNYIWTGSTKMY